MITQCADVCQLIEGSSPVRFQQISFKPEFRYSVPQLFDQLKVRLDTLGINVQR